VTRHVGRSWGADDLQARLYAVGDQEPLSAPTQEIVKRLRCRNYPRLIVESRLIAGERHSGNKPEAFNRAVRFLFQRYTEAETRPPD
jgi:hypothetical protein